MVAVTAPTARRHREWKLGAGGQRGTKLAVGTTRRGVSDSANPLLQVERCDAIGLHLGAILVLPSRIRLAVLSTISLRATLMPVARRRQHPISTLHRAAAALARASTGAAGPDYPPDEAEPQHSTPPSKSACQVAQLGWRAPIRTYPIRPHSKHLVRRCPSALQSPTLRRHRSKAKIPRPHTTIAAYTPLSQSPTARQATVFPALHLFNLCFYTCASLGTWSRFDTSVTTVISQAKYGNLAHFNSSTHHRLE
ncbi:hypothetical protein QBC39DRAFT_91339 [Podospora conica]|nr:hypothetical protein QBC39DRAFT_91339 [Schizothecium conicum]